MASVVKVNRMEMITMTTSSSSKLNPLASRLRNGGRPRLKVEAVLFGIPGTDICIDAIATRGAVRA